MLKGEICLKNKAVILGSNYYIGLSAMRCLGRQDVPVVGVDYSDEGTYGFRSKYCSEKLIGPHYKKEPEKFVQFLIEYAKKQEKKPVLLPCADPYVEVVDRYMDRLREYYLMPSIEKGLLTQLLNKETLERLAKKHEVVLPETIRTTEDNFLEKIDREIKYPCLVKPVNSHKFVSIFRRKMFKVFSKQELIKTLERVKKEKVEVIIQRIIPGFDDHMYTFDAYLNQRSQVTHWTTCQKQRQYPINFGASVYTKQTYVPKLYEIGSAFLEAIGYKGFAEIEFKKDADTGKFYLIEVNVRFSNLNVLLNRVGINMPYVTYQELVGEAIGTKAITEETNRYFIYLYEDLLAARDYIKKGQLSLGDIVRSYFNKKACALWSLDDPKPFFAFNKKIMKKVVKKIF